MAATTMLPVEDDMLGCSNISDTNVTSNSTNSTCGGDFNQFIMPWWRQVVWTLIYIALVIVATGGNIIVIWIVLAHKQMRTITNFFLVNLAVSDCMMSLMNITFNFVYFLNSHWPFGEAYCKIVQFVSVLSVTASVFTLVAISVDRYSAIMHPLKPRMGRHWTLLVTIAIWVVAAVLAAPNYLLSQTYTFVYNDGGIRTLCYLAWPDGETMESTLEAIYNGAIFVLTYFLPLAATTYCYTRMSVELWGSQSIGEATPVQIESVNSKRRVVKMMMVLVAIFAVCWLPYQVYFLAIPLYSELTHKPMMQEVFLGIYWLAMSNSMYNPLIYYWMNSRFRMGFQSVFRCAGRIPQINTSAQYRHPSQSHHTATRVTIADLKSATSTTNGTNGTNGRAGTELTRLHNSSPSALNGQSNNV